MSSAFSTGFPEKDAFHEIEKKITDLLNSDDKEGIKLDNIDYKYLAIGLLYEKPCTYLFICFLMCGAICNMPAILLHLFCS